MSKKDPNDPQRLARLDAYVGRMARLAKLSGPQRLAAKARAKAKAAERLEAWRERMKANRQDNAALRIGMGATRRPFDRERRRRRNRQAERSRARNR